MGAVSVYLDASILVSLFVNDTLTVRAEAFLRAHPSVLIVSDFAAAEFAAAVARRVRIGTLTADEARTAFLTFDTWTARATEREQTRSVNVSLATGFLRRLNLAPRAPDAINIAMAQRLGADLLTFDEQMAAGARVLGTAVLAG